MSKLGIIFSFGLRLSILFANNRVYNEATSDNLTMHWHGISQYGSPFADGTPYASQWPIPAGKYFDYEFQFEDDLDGTLYISLLLTRSRFSWYHSHIGTQTLTCHGALIVAAKCGNPADCPCTHVNCGREGDQCWDWIANDWSPTVGVDMTVDIEVTWNGGSVEIKDDTEVWYSNGNGGSTSGSSGGSPGGSSGWISGTSEDPSGGSSSGSSSGSGGSGSGSGVSLSDSTSSDPNQGSSSSSDSSSSSHGQCCNCGCNSGSQKKHKKRSTNPKKAAKVKKSELDHPVFRRGIHKRDTGNFVTPPPNAFNTSCSNSPIPYDEERIIILEDMFNNQDSTLSQQAL